MHVCLLPPMPKNKNKQQNAALQRKKSWTHHPQRVAVKLLTVHVRERECIQLFISKVFTQVNSRSRT